MKNLINKIINFIYGNKPVTQTIADNNLSNTILKCTFLVDNFEKVKISVDWPNTINEANLDQISYISSYFLFLLNHGFLKEQILNTLKNSHNPTDAIMYQNIMFHTKLIEAEAKSIIDSKNTSEPLIKPSAVFSRK
jgi:hypothetical protein